MNGAAARMKGIRWERAVANYYGTSTTRSLAPVAHHFLDCLLRPTVLSQFSDALPCRFTIQQCVWAISQPDRHNRCRSRRPDALLATVSDLSDRWP